MNNFLFWGLFLLLTKSAVAQEYVQWNFSFDSSSSSFVAQANIDQGWHLYSQYNESEFGPIPTEFNFETDENVKLIGKTTEPESIMEYDPNFEGELHFFKDQVRFAQEMNVTNAEAVKGTVTYMVCNEEMCMPPKDVEFEIKVENEK